MLNEGNTVQVPKAGSPFEAYVIGQLGKIIEKQGEHDKQFKNVIERLESHDEQFDAVSFAFDQQEERLEEIKNTMVVIQVQTKNTIADVKVVEARMNRFDLRLAGT